ncbi:MAG: transporter [Bacteroidales bacterium]|nr:transporter [Bacteroidales bacterium]MCM1147232.1 transporter [Bacteroidales bacterium]MCM1207199.1 transporter [Bacillota bacterium]MCM1509738.1 hypothetical protein [Clostridium sp.]
MKFIKMACLMFLASASIGTAHAGGMLTNTNQNIAFLRNPAREGAIGIDGVYSNPAGVAFLNNGMHLSLNWQAAFQTRTVFTTSPFLDHTLNGEEKTKRYKGNAQVPFIPSIQAAYNTGRWSFQFGFAISGGGGTCEFDKGLGSFESTLGGMATMMKDYGVNSYDMEGYMQGKQYYFGVTLGAAYKINDHLSVYGGIRGLYGMANYQARISDIIVNGNVHLDKFVGGLETKLDGLQAQLNSQLEQLPPLEMLPPEVQAQFAAAQAQINSGRAQLAAVSPYKYGVDLESDQTGFGIAPIIGVDYKIGTFNFAGKYEFRTRMSMKNKSNLAAAGMMSAVEQFVDGTSVREDSPALLALGAQWSVLPNVRINAGYHHFYDKQSKKAGNKQELLSGGTNEYLGGIEWNTTEKVTVSAGLQVTRYGLTDEYMSDISFVTNSTSFGFGCKYKVNKNVSLQAAYFKTFYDKYKTADGMNEFTRSNDVVGVGCDIEF